MNYVYMSMGGVVGVITRYAVGGAVYRWIHLGPPYGTFLVNVTGCFGIGFFITLFELKGWLDPGLRSFLFIGFLGAYTTFSTYMLENFVLLEQGRFWTGLGNMVLSVTLGFLALWLGVGAAKGLA